MTWAEFQIRAYAFNRMEQRKDLRAREIAWASLISFHSDPKKLPKTKDKFWQIGIAQKIGISDAHKEAIKKAQDQYLKDLIDGR